MKYEYGYTIICGGETATHVLGACEEAAVEQKRKEIDHCNQVERGPNIRGIVRPQESFWFVRPSPDKVNR